MRTLIFSTAPWATTGYAKAAANVGLALKARGHDVGFFAWNTIRSVIFEWQGMTVYPAGHTENGADILPGHVQHFQADVLLGICDPWIMRKDHWRRDHDAAIAFWFPCQAEPASPTLLDVMEAADVGLCFSHWGTEVMRRAGAENVQYCPLGVDLDVYRPLEREECRQWLAERLQVDLADRFVIGMVAANSSTLPLMRKAFDQNLLAFRQFLDEVNDRAVMYLHTWRPGYPGGFDLEPLIASLGLEIGRHVFFPNQYAYRVGLNDRWMAQMFNALDVLTGATLGEGFGLPVLEAQACGVPVVTSNWSSLPELTAHGHIARLSNRQWAPGEMEGWVGIPDVFDIVAGFERVYRGQLRTEREDGLKLARRLTWDNAVDEFLLPALVGVVNGVNEEPVWLAAIA